MFTVRQVGAEWCAFHPGGREIARSHSKELLSAYIDSLNFVEQAIARITGDGVDQGVSGSEPVRDGVPEVHRASPGAGAEGAAVTLAKVSYKTRTRSTGASTASGRLADKSWAAVCYSHGASTPASAGLDAEKKATKPEDWCADCGLIADGLLPKVPKP